jgi:hypothetical protein
VISKHRKTLVREEGWPLVDGWYWCPISAIEERVDGMAVEYEEFMGRIGVGYEFQRWEANQHKLDRRLAHQCADGKIRAPSWVDQYQRKGGGTSLYGKCKGCGESLSVGIKTIIIMEQM